MKTILLTNCKIHLSVNWKRIGIGFEFLKQSNGKYFLGIFFLVFAISFNF